MESSKNIFKTSLASLEAEKKAILLFLATFISQRSLGTETPVYYCYKIYLAQMNQFVMVVKTFFGFEFRVTVFARQDGLWIEILFSVVILQTGIGSELFQAVRTFEVFLKQMRRRVMIVSPFFGPISLEITIK